MNSSTGFTAPLSGLSEATCMAAYVPIAPMANACRIPVTARPPVKPHFTISTWRASIPNGSLIYRMHKIPMMGMCRTQPPFKAREAAPVGEAHWRLSHGICYEHYGDIRFLESHYEGMKRWVEYLRLWAKDNIVYKKRPGDWVNLGDWSAPVNPPPVELVDTYFYAQCVLNAARAARLAGKEDDANRYENLHREICSAFHAAFYNTETVDYGPYGATALALAMGAPPEPLRPAILASQINRILKTNHGHLDTGIFATPCLFDQLCKAGRIDVVATMINQTDAPGYGWWITQGATTLWEKWNGQLSHNHPMFSGGTVWLYQHLAGIQTSPEQPGYKQVIFMPQPADNITNASYYFTCLRGRIGANWTAIGNEFKLNISLPPNSTGLVYIPMPKGSAIEESNVPVMQAKSVKWLRRDGNREIYEIGSGEYKFSVRPLNK